MWDTSIVYHENKYYLFSMFRYHGGKDLHVWCAVSEDGVHFQDVGAVITDTKPVWKMFVHRFGDTFVMNNGSFSGKPGHENDTLRFHTSKDLIHWDFCGEDMDSHPDPRWYREEQRWDHMYTVDYEGKYYGFVVATPKPETDSFGCGMMVSVDGLKWEALPPVKIDWGDETPVNFEVGGCEKLGDKYYLIGGLPRVAGNEGYSIIALEADSPLGTFRPLKDGMIIYGTSHGNRYHGVSWLASFARGEKDELLLTNYVTAQKIEELCFIGLHQNVWFLPIKKPFVDTSGKFRLGYWKKNDLLKGTDITPCDLRETFLLSSKSDSYALFSRASSEKMLTQIPDCGVFIEGTAVVRSDGRIPYERFGFAFKGDGDIRTVTVQGGNPKYTHAQIEDWKADTDSREIIDVVEPYTAGKTNFIPEIPFTFKLLCHADIFELYIDDVFVQTYHTPDHVKYVSLYLENAEAQITSLQIYEMMLEGICL
ncbi:MAG: hypothetical protein IKC46_00790 [Lachnospiraceae bacterium]|nr:hypothetical protein [Lachnospiraceae bacterium]